MSYFITGTDTHVGKTVIACAILSGLSAHGLRVIGMKPVAAGCEPQGLHEDVRQLIVASNVQAELSDINPYCFTPAIAPHIAARQAGVEINLNRIYHSFSRLSNQSDTVIVEGAGGFLVPLNDAEDSADLAVKLGLPVILVVGLRLGCLNHALLTVHAIRSQGLVLAGWVANGTEGAMERRADNIIALQQRIEAPMLGVVPYQTLIDGPSIAAYLNFERLKRQEIDIIRLPV